MNEGNLLGISVVQAQETTPATSPKGGAFGMFVPMILVFVIFYVLMLRPQQKQLLHNLKKGDEVVTTAGIHAKVTGIADNIVTVEIADNIRIKLDKNHIAVVKSGTPSTGSQ
jgi:preprotein translocase subunit YajC